MSVITFLKKIGQDIAQLWEKIAPSAQMDLIIATKAAEVLKIALSLDVVDYIGHFAGAMGVVWEDKLKAVLPKVIESMVIAQGCIVQDNINQTIENVLAKVKLADSVEQNLFYHNLAVKIGAELQGKQITLSQLMQLIQWVYLNKVKGAAVAVA